MAFQTIWLTDRTRYETGTGRCARKRYLSCHAGPTGYGYAPKGESVPLSTGLHVHHAADGLCTIMQDQDREPTVAEVRSVVKTIRSQYDATLKAKGFLGGLYDSAITDETIKEQSVLIGGLVWVLALRFLPWLHTTYRVLEVEQERLHFLDCTCGAPALDAEEHDRRGCEGHALMLRTDILAQHRQSQNLAYFEIKTTGWDSDAWAEQWETKPQLGLGTLDLDKRYGREVTEIFIVALSKGARKKDKTIVEGDPLAGMRRQSSPLVYGYCRPGNPPLAKDDWLPQYEWINDAGETKRASRAHRKRGIWELRQSDWAVWQAYHQSDPELAAEEFWVRQLPSSVLEKICYVLGPLNRQDAQIQSLRRSMLAEEHRWQTSLWRLHELGFLPTVLDEFFPQSWNCRPFGKEHQCEFHGICFGNGEDPMTSGFYVPRLPHHAPERSQATSRGLLVEQATEVDDE